MLSDAKFYCKGDFDFEVDDLELISALKYVNSSYHLYGKVAFTVNFLAWEIRLYLKSKRFEIYDCILAKCKDNNSSLLSQIIDSLPNRLNKFDLEGLVKVSHDRLIDSVVLNLKEKGPYYEIL